MSLIYNNQLSPQKELYQMQTQTLQLVQYCKYSAFVFLKRMIDMYDLFCKWEAL